MEYAYVYPGMNKVVQAVGRLIRAASDKGIVVLIGERFAEDILELEPGLWQGPILSGYGLHLVFVTKLVPERLPEIDEVLNLVKRD